MKRVGYLYDKVIDLSNIIAAMEEYNSRREAKKRVAVNEQLAAKIQHGMMTDYAAVIGKPRKAVINEYGKKRELEIPSYKSSIAQLALWRVCGKYIDKRLHNQTFSSRRGYGGHLAARKCKKFVHMNIEKDAKYHLYFDISKFYKHVQKDIVMKRIETVFKDARVLSMFRDIVNSADAGLPIGYPFSHALANLYLTPLYFELRKIKFISKIYVYMDNWTVFSRYKKSLHKAYDVAESWLAGVGCQIKKDWQIAPTACRQVKMCGFRIGKGSTKLYQGTFRRLMRNIKQLSAYSKDDTSPRAMKLHRSLMSRLGWVKEIHQAYSPIFRTDNGWLWNIKRKEKTT